MNSKTHTSHSEIPVYMTKDGSQISELMHPSLHASQNQSLAEAMVPAGTTTHLHRYYNSEELYHITAGGGIMRLDEEEFEVKTGDTICSAPRTAHCIRNTGTEDLVILCCCSPAYSHKDPEIL